MTRVPCGVSSLVLPAALGGCDSGGGSGSTATPTATASFTPTQTANAAGTHDEQLFLCNARNLTPIGESPRRRERPDEQWGSLQPRRRRQPRDREYDHLQRRRQDHARHRRALGGGRAGRVDLPCALGRRQHAGGGLPHDAAGWRENGSLDTTGAPLSVAVRETVYAGTTHDLTGLDPRQKMLAR